MPQVCAPIQETVFVCELKDTTTSAVGKLKLIKIGYDILSIVAVLC